MESGLSRKDLLVGSVALALGSGRGHVTPRRWAVRCVDTMKTSRDACRQPIDARRAALVRAEVATIKELGATHVAVATPYDPEFVPFLRHWTHEVHAQGLKVWFRGNFCGWEGWFDYPKWDDSYDRHIAASVEFIQGHPDLFESGDSFSLCPEPENSALLHDPRAANGHPVAFRKFLGDSVEATERAFRALGKRVETNWLSVNGDVGRDILDRATADRMGGLVTIDHYVPSVAKMVEYVDDIHAKFGCKVLIGEFGAPLSGVNGKDWSPARQAEFVGEILEALWRASRLCARRQLLGGRERGRHRRDADLRARGRRLSPPSGGGGLTKLLHALSEAVAGQVDASCGRSP